MDKSSIQLLSEATFDEQISHGVTLVDFFAEWCGPCKMLTPILGELAKELDGQATIGKLDIDAAQNLTAKLEVHSVPTLILFKNGEEVRRVVGVKDKNTLKQMVLSAV